MPLTREFRETVHARVNRDPAYRRALLSEGLAYLLGGDLDTGKSVLRDYINATVGFEELGALIGKSPKSLMRMLSASGNPRASNLLGIIAKLQELEGVHFGVHAAG